MSKIFGLDIDLNNNEALNFRHENQITFPTLTGSESGFTFYHSANQKFYGWTGTAWLDFSAAGGGGGGVTSFNSRTGAVVPVLADYQSFYVDRTTSQSIAGVKSFSSSIHAQAGRIIFNDDASTIGYASGGSMGYLGLSQYYFHQDHATIAQAAGILDFNTLSADRIFTFPDQAGTIPTKENTNVWSATNRFNGLTIHNSVAAGGTGGSSSGVFRYAGSSQWALHKDNSNVNGLLDFTNLTANRVFSFPDTAGDVAIVEEGSWTPTLVDKGAGATYTLSSATGTYLKVGKMTTIRCSISITSTSGSGTGGLAIQSLPFAISNNATCAMYMLNSGQSFYSVMGWGSNSEVQVFMQTALDGSMAGITAPSITSGTIVFTMTYIATT